MYLFCVLLIVPAGFVLTAVMIGIQALTRGDKAKDSTPGGRATV